MANINTGPRAEHGGMIVDGQQVSSTLMCPHCGAHFEYRPGSGTRRGFCLKCYGVTCGHPKCNTCIPLEARLDHVEGRKTAYDDLIKDLQSRGGHLL